jgi:hypothetical protein
MTEWRKNNPEKAAEQKLAYREKQKLADAEYYQRNRDKKLEYAKGRLVRRAELNLPKREELKLQAREWRKANPEISRATTRKYRELNPDIVHKSRLNRAARLSGCKGSISKGLADRLLKFQKGKCITCRNILGKFHMDHIEPLSKGGENIDMNIQLLCPSCNCSKNNRDPIEFMQSRGFLI